MSYLRDVNLTHSGGTVSGEPERVARAVAFDWQMAQEQAVWVADLRAQGVRAAHPDDGWVNRERNTVYLCYPQFNDEPALGDIIALGSPSGPTRLVTVYEISRNRLDLSMRYYHFEAAASEGKQQRDV